MPATIRMPFAEDSRADASTRVVSPAAAEDARVASECPTCGTIFSGSARFCPFDGDPLRRLPAYQREGDPLVGRELGGRYRVERLLGEGGMGKVYAARHVAIDKPCAVKVLRRDVAVERDAVERFLQEAKVTARLSHPNIVAVSDFGELGDEELPGLGELRLPWFVMELLSGETLASRLRRERPLPPADALAIGRACADGLAAAHGQGVVHRDLKPDNVFLTPREDGTTTVKLLDFGVAKVAGASKKTRKGMTFGTPHYMSPEQATGESVDGRADLYALGVILYECVAGEVPFVADTFMGVLTKHLYATPEPLEHVVDPAALGELGAVVARCLAKRPDDRFADAGELVAALARAESGLDTARRATSSGARTVARRLRDEVLSREPAARELPVVDEEDAPRRRRVRRTAWTALAVFAGITGGVALARSLVTRPSVVAPAPENAAATQPLESGPGLRSRDPVPEPDPVPDPASVPVPVPVSGSPAPLRGSETSPDGSVPASGARSRPPRRAVDPPADGRVKGEVVDPWSD